MTNVVINEAYFTLEWISESLWYFSSHHSLFERQFAEKLSVKGSQIQDKLEKLMQINSSSLIK